MSLWNSNNDNWSLVLLLVVNVPAAVSHSVVLSFFVFSFLQCLSSTKQPLAPLSNRTFMVTTSGLPRLMLTAAKVIGARCFSFILLDGWLLVACRVDRMLSNSFGG